MKKALVNDDYELVWREALVYLVEIGPENSILAALK